MLTLDSYHNDKYGSLGKTSSCSDCRKKLNEQYRNSHKEYFRDYQIKHRKHLSEYKKKWLAANRHKIQQYAVRGQIKRQQALDSCLPDDNDYMSLMEKSEPICVLTGVTVNTELDHVLAVSKGNWGNNRGNLMWLYTPLNTSKGNSNIFDWMEQMSQDRLDYLLPEGTEMTVSEFQDRLFTALTIKATEKGLTFEQYKQQYNDSFHP